MDMEITRLANVSWLQISDRQVFAIRATAPSFDRSRTQPAAALHCTPQTLPPLDWPPTLFQDETSCY